MAGGYGWDSEAGRGDKRACDKSIHRHSCRIRRSDCNSHSRRLGKVVFNNIMPVFRVLVAKTQMFGASKSYLSSQIFRAS